MFVALVADDMTVVDIEEVLGADHLDVEGTHGASNVVPVDFTSLVQSFFRVLQLFIVRQDVLLDFMLTLNQLILG